MAGSKKLEPIPATFRSVEEAADFWDHHDLADYEGQTTEVSAAVDLRRRTFLAALEPELAKKVSAYAQRQGIATETLINVWLSEKLLAATTGE
jgi:hypothetical protein